MRSFSLRALARALPPTFLPAGCATLTNDPMQQINFVAPDCGPEIELTCTAENKRGRWKFSPPATTAIRRSDDLLHITCFEPDRNVPQETSIPSSMSPKIAASAVFLDFGVTDAITDRHREYPPQIILNACRNP